MGRVVVDARQMGARWRPEELMDDVVGGADCRTAVVTRSAARAPARPSGSRRGHPQRLSRLGVLGGEVESR